MSTCLRQWFYVTLGAAVVVSAVDALLLQRSRSYFTGGFLSVDYLDGPGAIGMFVVVSLLVDASVAGLLAGIAIWILGRWRVSQAALMAGGLIGATIPLMLADAATYELDRYLGTGFDLGLMFDLTGRSVAEMLAVSSSHLLVPSLVVAAVGMLAGGFVWGISRIEGPRSVAPPIRGFLVPLAVVVAGAVVFTVAASASDALENGLRRKPSGQLLRFAVDEVTDIDSDGFGLFGRLPDPDPRNSAVFPFAVDIPGNGLDEDGVAGDLPPDSEKRAEPMAWSHGWERKPDIVVVVLESFRADLVGARYGDRPITPVLNAVAEKGVSLTRAYSHNGYTVQSRFHILAGRLVAHPNSASLVDDFKANGYVVGYFSGQDESFGSAEYDVGFDRADVANDARSDIKKRYSTFATPGSLSVPFQVVKERVDEFLRDKGHGERPMFLYVNFEDTHFPYSHAGMQALVSSERIPRSQISPERRDVLWAMYANTAANVDRAVGEVLDTVRRVRGREPGVVITADHGESLFESGFLGHGYGLNDVQTRVPLIVANVPMRLPEPFGHVDLRGALTEALTVPTDMPAVPVIQEEVDREVFQYLGDLPRPRQIAFLRNDKRFIYDFRSRRVQAWDGAWRRPSDLALSDRDVFLRLVHQWEWMNLGQRAGLGDDQ